MIRLSTSLALLACLTGCVSTQPFTCDDVTGTAIKAPPFPVDKLAKAPVRHLDRRKQVVGFLEDIRCPDLVVDRFGRRNSLANISCRIQGEVPDEIVIGAHYDKLGPGRGIADNWSGLLALVTIARYVQQRGSLHTIRVIAFDGEEAGLLGSRRYLELVRSGARPRPLAMINIDTIGAEPLRLASRSDDFLKCITRRANPGQSLESQRLRPVEGDWLPFRRSGIPVLAFQGLSEQLLKRLHGYQDNADLINEDLLQHSLEAIIQSILIIDGQLSHVATAGQ